MRGVSIVGIGETTMGNLNLSLREMVAYAGNASILDAGIEKQDIQAVFLGNYNAAYLCNQNHLGPMVSEALGLGYIPTIRTEGACASGGLAFRMGFLSILCGMYDAGQTHEREKERVAISRLKTYNR